MKLFIRSQDKTRLLESNDIRIEPIQLVNANDNNTLNVIEKTVGVKMIVNGYVVAKYDTLEKGLQVLDDIQKALIGKIILETKQSKIKKDDAILESQPINIKPLNQNCVVYELP